MNRVLKLQVLGTWANVQALRERLRQLELHAMAYWQGPKADELRGRLKNPLSRDELDWLIAETEYYEHASKLKYLEAGRRAHAHNKRKFYSRGGGW